MSKPSPKECEEFVKSLSDMLGCDGGLPELAAAFGGLRAKSDRLDEVRQEVTAAQASMPSEADVSDLARGINDDPTDILTSLRGVREALSSIQSKLFQ
jgi:hypothetical protein